MQIQIYQLALVLQFSLREKNYSFSGSQELTAILYVSTCLLSTSI